MQSHSSTRQSRVSTPTLDKLLKLLVGTWDKKLHAVQKLVLLYGNNRTIARSLIYACIRDKVPLHGTVRDVHVENCGDGTRIIVIAEGKNAVARVVFYVSSTIPVLRLEVSVNTS